MQVTETSAEGLHREFTVKVPADDIENKLNQFQEEEKIFRDCVHIGDP